MKAKESNSRARSTETRAVTRNGNGAKVQAGNGVIAYQKDGAARHVKNGSLSKPVNAGSKKENAPLKFKPKPLGKKKLARLEKLKAYLDSLDEDAQIREFEKLPLFDMHWLMCRHLAEEKERRERPVSVTMEVTQELYDELAADAQWYGIASVEEYVSKLVKATYVKEAESMPIFDTVADWSTSG